MGLMALRSRRPRPSHQRRKAMALRKYARRVCGFWMWTVKYSAKRVTASSPASVRIAGRTNGPVTEGLTATVSTGTNSLPVVKNSASTLSPIMSPDRER